MKTFEEKKRQAFGASDVVSMTYHKGKLVDKRTIKVGNLGGKHTPYGRGGKKALNTKLFKGNEDE